MSPRPSKKPAKSKATPLYKAGDVAELVLLRVDDTMGACRYANTKTRIQLRAKDVWQHQPGEILTVKVKSLGPTTLSGTLVGSAIDATKLALKPLALESLGDWDPTEEYWGEEGEPLEDWAKPVFDAGIRPAYEMEQVIPGFSWDDPDEDPISEAADAMDAGDFGWAREKLESLAARDLRCLDAHAHLGNIMFDGVKEWALNHYSVGVAIGDLSLPADRNFVLPWSAIDNRPYLRCLFGKALVLWRMNKHEDAAATFEKILWLNPMDNQGARFNLPRCQNQEPWTPD